MGGEWGCGWGNGRWRRVLQSGGGLKCNDTGSWLKNRFLIIGTKHGTAEVCKVIGEVAAFGRFHSHHRRWCPLGEGGGTGPSPREAVGLLLWRKAVVLLL